MKKKYNLRFIFSFILVSFMIFSPFLVSAQAGVPLVPEKCKGGELTEGECGWEDLLQLVSNVMLFMVYLATFLGTVAIAYAGFLYLTAFGEMGKIERAHNIFTMVAIGIFFTLAGWLIVATILKTLGVDPDFSLIDFSGVETFKSK